MIAALKLYSIPGFAISSDSCLHHCFNDVKSTRQNPCLGKELVKDQKLFTDVMRST